MLKEEGPQRKATEPAAPAKPEDAADASDLATALSWVSQNLRLVLAGRPVRDADECLSFAERLLGGSTQEPALKQEPSEVDWVACADSAAYLVTHLSLQGRSGQITLANYDLTNLFAQGPARKSFPSEKTIFSVETGGPTPGGFDISIGLLAGAREETPGVVRLKDGRKLVLWAEVQDRFCRFSPAAGELVGLPVDALADVVGTE